MQGSLGRREGLSVGRTPPEVQKRLRDKLEELEGNVSALGRLLEIDNTSLSYYLGGTRQPSPAVLLKMAKKLNTTTSVLLNEPAPAGRESDQVTRRHDGPPLDPVFQLMLKDRTVIAREYGEQAAHEMVMSALQFWLRQREKLQQRQRKVDSEDEEETGP